MIHLYNIIIFADLQYTRILLCKDRYSVLIEQTLAIRHTKKKEYRAIMCLIHMFLIVDFHRVSLNTPNML